MCGPSELAGDSFGVPSRSVESTGKEIQGSAETWQWSVSMDRPVQHICEGKWVSPGWWE